MDNAEIKRRTLSGFIWKFSEKIGVQIIQFFLQIVLARLLLPEDYGVVAIITVLISIADVFVEGGFGQALIQKKHTDDLDYSSIFWLNIGVSCVLYVVLFCLSPLIAEFYHLPQLKNMVRLQGLILIISAFNIVQKNLIQRELKFKIVFRFSLAGVAVQGLVGIICALNGLGAWSLIISYICNYIVVTAIIWITVKWRPKAMFSGQRVKSLFAFGSKLLGVSLFNTLYNNVYNLIIGRVYSADSLGYYNRGQSIPYLLYNNINITINGVSFPMFSQYQDDMEQIKNLTRRCTKTLFFVVAPLLVGVVGTAPSIVSILLTEKWNPCIPFMQLMSISYLTMALQSVSGQAMLAIGESGAYMKMEIVKKVISIVLIIGAIPFGVYTMVGVSILSGIAGVGINVFYSKRLLGYRGSELARDILPTVGAASIMGGVVYVMNGLSLNVYALLVVQVVIGMIVYILASFGLKNESLYYLFTIIRQKIAPSEN